MLAKGHFIIVIYVYVYKDIGILYVYCNYYMWIFRDNRPNYI